MSLDNIELFPITTRLNESGHVEIGGCDTVELVSEYGTPLYLYDETTLRTIAREFIDEFTSRYPSTTVAYASKAFINPVIADLVNQENLGLDVVSGGELAVAQSVGFPLNKVYFHGNNKTPQELEAAIKAGIGRIVVDGLYELSLLNELAGKVGIKQDIMLRLSPGVDPHTHAKTTTGILDSKFGISIDTGDARQAMVQALAAENLELVGLHCHLGSPIFELEPYSIAIDTMLAFAAEFKQEGFVLREFSPGGGFAIGYVMSQQPPRIAEYAEAITKTLKTRSADLGLGEPQLVIEPGRSIVGRAGVALYSVGAVKTIPTIRKYVSLDGGMGDNIRPALYDSSYEAVVANRPLSPPEEIVTLVGKFCESGDYLIKDINLPTLNQGDIIAIPSSGAYAPSMASNYNLNPKPPIVMLKGGDPTLIRRRETYQDMMSTDVW